MIEIVIDENNEDIRADKFIIKYLKTDNVNFIYKMIRKKNILINNAKIKNNQRLKKGDIISVYLSDDTLNKIKTNKLKTEIKKIDNKNIDCLDIVYEDSNFLFINKPKNILSQKANSSDVSITEIVFKYLDEKNELAETFNPGPSNRLDRNTQGLICFGKNYNSTRFLNELFKNRSIKKYYYAICIGAVVKDIFLDSNISKDTCSNKVFIDDNSKINIKTHIMPVATNEELSIVNIHLITGKAHQIRFHLSNIAHPIVGDYKYGNGMINDKYKERFNVSSQMLVAYKLIFPDNIEGRYSYLSGKIIECEPEKVFNNLCKYIKEDDIFTNRKFTLRDELRGINNDII